MTHEERVGYIAKQIKARANSKTPIKIQKDAISHFVPNPYDNRDKLPKVDITGLNNIISIDPQKKVCIAEPGVTFVRLVEETIKHGLIPYTVPELKTITLGGAISGCSIESMSYKYGGFHDSCIEYEVVTGTGLILNCTTEVNKEIFHMLHGSYGTLGIITKITFKLLPAKPYVQMDYVSFKDFDSFWVFLKDRSEKDDYDFVDAIIHSKKKLVVCLGRMVDEVPYTSDYTWLKIFYKSTAKLKEDYFKISDYFFRYDTECHWLTRTVPLFETLPMRLALGKLVLGSTNLIKWSKKLKNIMKLKKRPEVVVDVFIPAHRFKEFFDWYVKEFDFYPLWIVPYRAPEKYPWIDDEYAKGLGGNFYIDCAVYGKKNSEPNKDYSEILEKKTIELGGLKTLISRNHFDRDTFWKIYNKRNYYDAKTLLDPKNLFNDLYDKFSPERYK